MSNKEDKGFVVLGPELPSGGRAAIKVDKDGAHTGELFSNDNVPRDSECTQIETQLISGNIHQIIEEKPIGKPSKANSPAYRNNYDTIFGNKQVVGTS
jgi:hypothetical protein